MVSGRWLVGNTRIYIARYNNFSFSGVLSDATKSVSRAYINNFQDKAKQNAIDTFLVGFDEGGTVETPDAIQGNLSNQLQVTIYDPVHDYVRATLEKRYGFCIYFLGQTSDEALQFPRIFK